MTVREAMTTTISTAGPDDTVAHAAGLMRAENCGFIPVVDGGRVVGVVTDRDIVMRCIAVGRPRDGAARRGDDPRGRGRSTPTPPSRRPPSRWPPTRSAGCR